MLKGFPVIYFRLAFTTLVPKPSKSTIAWFSTFTDTMPGR
jgi:hypothetical protein